LFFIGAKGSVTLIQNWIRERRMEHLQLVH
jgi:hypothetical protein